MAEKLKLFSISGKGKGFGIFRSSEYKEHKRPPMAQLFWKFRWLFLLWIATIAAFGLSFAVEHIWRYGWSPATARWCAAYFNAMFGSYGLSIFAEIPAWVTRVVMRTDFPVLVPFIPIVLYNMLTTDDFLKEFNPYGKDAFAEKSARKANADDIKKMGNKGGSLFDGFMVVLGRFDKKYIKMDETLSVLVMAPPGTGKTQSVILPTIFECDTVSMIINDPKPELKQISSGYRSTIGPTFIMNWAGQDDPERGIYYPSWNPLSPEHVPYQPEERDLYVDSICAVLIADKASSTADPHWTISGRAALSGMVQFMVSKIEKAKADDYFKHRLDTGAFDNDDAALLDGYYAGMTDPNAEAARHILSAGQMNSMNYVHIGTWADIPTRWLGKEASFSLILDWMSESQINIAQEMENRKKQGDQMVIMEDSMKTLFLKAVDEARQFGYAHRAVLSFTSLANTPDKERGSILSTVQAGLGIFRNAAVRNRTSHSDFHFTDLRGVKIDGKWKPVTVYLSINQVDADALNPITGIFIELMSRFLLAHQPEDVIDGQKLGPTSVLFALDEMPKMMKMEAVIKGPDVGRGQKVSYLMIGQDLHQIAEKYGTDAMKVIMSTTAAKIVFRQNDMESAKAFSEMMGNKIEVKTSKDDKGKTKSEDNDKGALYSPMDIMKLDKEKQLVIFQGWPNRPIEADVIWAYKDDKIKPKWAMGEVASPIPEFLIPRHHAAMGYAGEPRYPVKK